MRDKLKKFGSANFVNIRTLDETLIVTYSPKYKTYQQKIRARQIERAEKTINFPCKKRKGKNQNDSMRFVKNTAVTNDGKIVEKKMYELDGNRLPKKNFTMVSMRL